MTRTEPPFRRVLIANRGEIAVRIIRACRELGMEAVAVYSDADAERRARPAWPTPRSASGRRRPPRATCGSTPSSTRRVATGAEAVHPGYGFLAERAAFARAVEDAGLVFVGPSPATIDALGDKLHARRLAATRRRAVVPGTLEPAPVDRPDQVAAIVADGRAASASRCWSRRPPAAAAAGCAASSARRTCRRRSRPDRARRPSAFGDGSVYLEREILPGPARRGPAARRRARHGRRAGRAGLLAPAAAPEARRGGACARAERDRSDASCTRWRSGSARRPACATRRPASSSSTRTGASGSSRSTRGSRWSTA